MYDYYNISMSATVVVDNVITNIVPITYKLYRA